MGSISTIAVINSQDSSTFSSRVKNTGLEDDFGASSRYDFSLDQNFTVPSLK